MKSLILRLDDPTDCSTRLTDLIKLRGWIGVPRDEVGPNGPTELTVDVVLDSDETTHSMVQQGVMLNGKRIGIGRGPTLNSLTISERGRALYGAGFEDTIAYDITGEINTADAFKGEQPVTPLQISLAARLGAAVVISNRVRVSFLPRTEWRKPFGGFLFPNIAFYNSDELFIEGWAMRLDDPVLKVELTLADSFKAAAEFGFESGHFGKALPDICNAENCIFRARIKRDEVVASGVTDRHLRAGIPISATVSFSSGKQHIFEYPSFAWGPVENLRVLTGEVEKVFRNGNGNIVIEGWTLAASGKRPAIFIEGWRRRTEASSSNTAARLSWTTRPEIEQRFITQILGSECGFEIEIFPQLLLDLGRYPGQIRVVAEQAGEKLVLSQTAVEKKLTQLVNERAQLDEGFRPIIARGIYLGEHVGLRKNWPVRPRAESSSKPVRIVFAAHNLVETEGAPKVLEQIISTVRTRTPDIEILVLSAQDGGIRDRLEQAGVCVKIVPELSLVEQTWERYGEALRAVIAKIEAFGPSLIYANVIESFWAVDLARRLSCPCCWLIHESEPPIAAHATLDPRLRMRMFSLLARARLIFVAEATAALYRHDNPENFSVIPNALDLQRFGKSKTPTDVKSAKHKLGIANDEIVISIIGTTTHRKGQDIFLREMRLLSDAMPTERFKFFIVGARDIPFLSTLQALTEELNLSGTVTFVAEQADIRDYFIASDILTICSRKESAPLVSLEAFASGTPLVSTNVFGLAEQVVHEKNALVFDHNTEGALCSAIRRLLNDPLLGQQLAEHARRDVEVIFSLDKTLEKHWLEFKGQLQTSRD